jgi:hypothetical protein
MYIADRIWHKIMYMQYEMKQKFKDTLVISTGQEKMPSRIKCKRLLKISGRVTSCY